MQTEHDHLPVAEGVSGPTGRNYPTICFCGTPRIAEYASIRQGLPRLLPVSSLGNSKALKVLPPAKRNFPWYTTDNGKWFITDDTFWISGYMSGCLWFQYLLTGKSKYLTEAIKHGTELQLIEDELPREQSPHNGPVLFLPFMVDAVVRSKTKPVPGLPLRQYEAAIVKAAEVYVAEE